ncbi:uncharacterized protein LOC123467737 [Daphnia magna]|uniref:uncharacterized protein LOC123467737 n=1 Tax=Daphnia magna TaxID=35525 RepID=UPI001E1BAA05|nr:uncharacterized protein LOC123467737 [Daphnia magna]
MVTGLDLVDIWKKLNHSEPGHTFHYHSGSSRSSIKWYEIEREPLIEAVKKYPCLYDTNSKSYKNITVKTNAKLEISHLFENCTVEDVTTQWTQLVDKFRRVRKVSNIEDPTGTPTKDSRHQLPQWDLYHTMFTNLSSAKVRHIDLVQERGVDQMENEEYQNTDKDNVHYWNDVSFVSVNDTQSLTLDNKSLVNSEDSLPISDALPSYPDSRIQRKRKLEESKAEKNISSLVSQLINDKPNHTMIEKTEELDAVTKQWRNYCKVFADKVAKIKSNSIKDEMRFKVEQLLYEAGKKEKEKSKRKMKEEDRINQS